MLRIMSFNQTPVTMCTALAATASSTGVNLAGGGRHQLLLSGTFGGATAKLQVSHTGQGGTWVDVTGASLTAPGTLEFATGGGALYRITTGAGTGTAIDGTAAQIE